jgi:hypothetical protein
MRGGWLRVSESNGVLHLPENLPRSIRNGLAWMAMAWLLATWLGFEAPWQRASKDREDWVQAHAVAVAQTEQQGRAIVVLQDRDNRTQSELAAIRQKLDEMSMVLYSMDRRSR